MGNHKFAAADVHAATTTFAVLDDRGKFVMETVVETKAESLLSVVKSITGAVHLTFEEGTHAAWLYDLLRPHVAKLVVCDPRKNRNSKENKNDRIDARQLARWLRSGDLSPVYHGHDSTKVLKELVRGYENLVADSARTKNRLKAIYRSQGEWSSGGDVYRFEKREEWLSKLRSSGLRSRAEWLYSQMEALDELKGEAERAVLGEAKKHRPCSLLKTVPGIGPIRSATIVAHVATPFRFRTKRQFWSYCGLAVVTRGSSDWEIKGEELRRSRRPVSTRGLNKNHNRHLKDAFKGAVRDARAFRPHLDSLIESGMRASMARLTVARKIAATTLAIWKKGEQFILSKAVIRSE
jgi:transposase